MYIDLIIKINHLITCTVYLEYEVPIMICIAISSIAEALCLDIRCSYFLLKFY